ncbi:hypothetical protein MLD38_040291 [Melastoma candidum]|uniref:Uncharacterized protein n=1 Tax=Melastoma candidum TaxID=119954 RepID=A0ACB9L4T9_9MYRT|nr:hypothetical protein MLD38_040291 [Melastoma candidum]
MCSFVRFQRTHIEELTYWSRSCFGWNSSGFSIGGAALRSSPRILILFCEYFFFQAKNTLLVCNHRSYIHWLVGWLIAQRASVLGNALAIMKKEAKFLPIALQIIGWSMCFSDYVFLSRNWAKDGGRLKSGFERSVDFPMPFWLPPFVDGTQFTKAKLAVAQEFAASKGLPIPRNLVVPRIKVELGLFLFINTSIPLIALNKISFL